MTPQPPDPAVSPETPAQAVHSAFDVFVQQDAGLPQGFNPMPMLELLRDAILARLESHVSRVGPADSTELREAVKGAVTFLRRGII